MATHSSILAWRIPMDTGTWQATVHGVAKSQTQLSKLAYTFPNIGFPSDSVVKNLPAVQEMLVRSLGQEDLLEKERLLTPIFLPEKFYGQRSLMGYSPWSCKRVRQDLVMKTNNI